MKTLSLFLAVVLTAVGTAPAARAANVQHSVNQVCRIAESRVAAQLEPLGLAQGYNVVNNVPYTSAPTYYYWTNPYWYNRPFTYFSSNFDYPVYGNFSWNSYYIQAPVARSPVPQSGLQDGTYQATASQTPITKATIEVYLPADAELWINGEKNTLAGSFRSFDTPSLTQGKMLTVEVRAAWKADGKQVTQNRTVQVQAGNQRILNFMGEGSGGK